MLPENAIKGHEGKSHKTFHKYRKDYQDLLYLRHISSLCQGP